MNVLMLAEVSSELVIGGAERVLREQLVGLSKRGHGAQAIVRSPTEDVPPRMVVDGISERRYTPLRGNAFAYVLSSIVRSVQEFDRGLAEGAPDAVLIHQSLAGLGPIFMRKKSSKKWVYVCHSLAHEEYATRNRPEIGYLSQGLFALHAQFRFWIERLVIRRCFGVVVLSEFMKNRVMTFHHVPEERIHLIPGGADHHRFCPSADRTTVRSQLGFREDAVLLFTVRNLVPRMGLESLIYAIAELRGEIPNVRVVLGGKGPLEATLRQLVQTLGLSDIVRFEGFIPDSDLPGYFQSADLVLMPTQELEGFGLVTVEALACGTPVLGTPIGAIPEVLSLVDSGLIAKASTSGALAEAMSGLIRRIREHPEAWAMVSRQARFVVEQHFTWVIHNTQLEAVLREPVPIGGNSR
jgi:glycosyltransferase involved in cell wall biosynthesis